MTAPEKRRLLVLSFHSPPSAAVGGLRWWGLSKYLVRRGWRVGVVTEGTVGPGGPPEEFDVARIARRTTIQDWYRAWRSRSALAARANTVPHVSSVASPPVSLRTLVRRDLAQVLDFPDAARGWLIRAWRASLDLATTIVPTVVVTTGPPHSLHVVGRLLARTIDAKHVIDYRDPWTDFFAGSTVSEWILRKIERYLVLTADAVLATTPELADELRRKTGRRDISWLPNGVDEELLPSRVAYSASPVEFVHVGTLYLRRDPTPIVRGFSRLLATSEPHEPSVALRFIGVVEEPYLGVLLRARESPALRERVSIEPPIPRADALEAVARARLAIVLATDQAALVPAKLYESVAMMVPTLVITDADSASASAARRVGAIVRTPDDVEGIAAVMREAARGELEIGATSGPPITHRGLAQLVDQRLSELLSSDA